MSYTMRLWVYWNSKQRIQTQRAWGSERGTGTERERENTITNVLMNRPSARVIVGGGGWGKQQLFINDHQSME